MIDLELSERIREQAIAYGFENCGIIPLSDLNGYDSKLHERAKKTGIGGLVFSIVLYPLTKLQKRYPWANSVVICTEWLGKYRFPQELQGKYGKAFLLSRNTVPGEDVYEKRIEFENWLTNQGIKWAGGETGDPVGTLPLREAAVKAGLGIIRKNNFFYGKDGSYYNLTGYIIDSNCLLKHEIELKPCSEKCNLCQNACKTKALCAPYTMNPLRCVSFWTAFGRNFIPPFLRKEQFGDWICGCDNCQDACPHNRNHDWNQGEDFPGLNDLVDLMQPEGIIHASKRELQERVVPKTYDHVRPNETRTLRRGARRVLHRK